jgi:hypothetical protein
VSRFVLWRNIEWWKSLLHTSFLPHYLAQPECLTADRQGQGDTRLSLTPSVILTFNYVIMVSDWNCLKYFFWFFCTVIIRCTETFWSPCIISNFNLKHPHRDSIPWTVRDRIPVGVRFFAHVQTGPGDHPASCAMGTGSVPGVKRPGRGADHPPPSSAEVTKGQSYTSIHPLGQFRPITGLLYLL